MPIYEYLCQKCGNQFEALFSTIAESANASCPSCKSKRVAKQFSTFAATSGEKDFACSDPKACPASAGCGGACAMQN